MTSATYGRQTPMTWPPPASALSARMAGVAMTTSPIQLGRKMARFMVQYPTPRSSLAVWRNRPASRRPHLLDQVARRKPMHQPRQVHAPSVRLNKRRADDLIPPIVRALDQHIRPNRLDQSLRRRLVEDHDVIDRAQPCQHHGAGSQRLQRPIRALERLDARVAVEADHENVALRLGLLQILHMPSM